MAQLVKADTKEIVDVPDDQAQALFQSGQYGLVPGSTLTVENKYGQTQAVKAEDVSDALSAGHRLVTPPKPKPVAPKEGEPSEEDKASQAKETALQDEYGGAGGATMATIFGIGRGLTFGLGDLAQVEGIRAIYGDEAAEDARKKLEGYKEANPWASGISEVAGGLAPALVTGGGSVAARGAVGAAEAATAVKEAGTLAKVGSAVLKYSPAGLTDLAAQAVEKQIGGVAAKVLLGEASENTLARLVVKGVEKGAGGAVYGALGGVGSEISEDVLGDREITGEKLAGAFGHGMFYGSLIGGGLGLGGTALSSGASWALENAAPAAKKASGRLAMKAIQYGGLSSKHMTEAAERLPGGADSLGNWLVEKGYVRAADNFESIAGRVSKGYEETGQTIRDGIAKLAVDHKGPKVADIIKDYAAIIEEKHGATKELRGQAYTTLDSISEMLQRKADADGHIAMNDLATIRRNVDKDINWRDVTSTWKNEALADARRTMEKHLEASVDDAGKGLSGDALKEYKDLKLDFQRLAVTKKLVDDAVTKELKNQGASVTEKGIAAMGVVHAVATGNPMAAAAGLAASAGHHVLKSYGASTGAALLAKVSDIGALQRTLGNMDQRMDKSVTSFLEGKPTEHETKIFTSAKARDEAFEGAQTRVKAAMANPEKSASAVQKALGSAVDYAPKIAQKAMYVAARGAQFLASKVPPTPPSRSITPQFEDLKEFTPEQKDKFLRYVKATDDPLSVIDDMSKGQLTREGVETLQEVYPQLYEELQKQAIAKCADAKHPLKYDQQIQLALFLNIPTAASLDPAFIGRMQAMYKEQGQGGGQSGGTHGPPKRPLQHLSKSTQLNARRSD